MRVQSESSVFKFLRRSVDEALDIQSISQSINDNYLWKTGNSSRFNSELLRNYKKTQLN